MSSPERISECPLAYHEVIMFQKHDHIDVLSHCLLLAGKWPPCSTKGFYNTRQLMRLTGFFFVETPKHHQVITVSSGYRII